MINILHVINGWPSGGIAEQTYLLVKHLPRDQFRQYSIGYCHFDGEFAKKFEACGVPCIESDKYYTNIKQIIADKKIDIVHKQTGGGDFPSYIIEARKLGIPVVETIHCPRMSSLPLNYVKKIIYTTDYTKNKNHHSYFNKMTPIQYALDLKEPFPFCLDREDNATIKVGRLGRIVPDKRPDVMLDVAELLWNHYGPDVEVHIAGMIPTDYEHHIKYGQEFLERAKNIPNVKYHGFVENKYDFWKSLDVALNPVWETSFDIVFLEAMACGIPIVTWDNSAAKYVVGNAGIVTEENVHSLYQGVCKLVDDPGYGQLLGAIGRGYIMDKYSLSTFIDSYTKLYKEVAND